MAAATTTLHGTATSCSSLAICKYTIASGAGSATTDAGVSGYVGQNFTFYGGSLSFQLPGEPLASYDNGVYNGQAINTNVFTSTAGLIYHVTGKFAAADYNTGMIMKGSTNGYVGIKGSSGKGGGIYFILLNGTISLTPTSLIATTVSVSCNPTTLKYGSHTICTAVVSNLLASITTMPTGTVTFYSTSGFSPIKCTLSSGTCSVKITPAPGTWPVYANYNGDIDHYKSYVRGPELYVTCPSGGC